MVTRSYVVLYRDDDGTVIDSKEADTEVAMLRQQVADLRVLLDNVRRIAFELSQQTLEGK